MPTKKKKNPEMKKEKIEVEKTESIEKESKKEIDKAELMGDKKYKKPWVRTLIGLFSLALIALIPISIVYYFTGGKTNRNKDIYSENQLRVIENFGKPQTFKFATQDGETLEYWRYLYLDEIFIFQDGDFVATQHYNFDVEEDKAIYFDLEPADFYQSKSIEDVNKLVDSKPTLEADIDDDILGKGYKFYSYGELLNITTHDGKIEVASTVAVKEKNGETATNTKKETETSQTDQEEEKGKVFIAASDLENSSYSYYLDNEKYRYIKQRPLITNDDEKASEIYGYCYTLDGGKSFSDSPQDPYACADNESMLWTIEMYELDVYENLDEMDKSYYEKLAENDEFIYVLSHANGDFPSELPIWIDTLDEIKNSFSVPMAQKYYDILHKK